MSRHTDEELFHTLGETARLLQGINETEGETYSLEDILAEFGQGAAKPAADAPSEVRSDDTSDVSAYDAPAADTAVEQEPVTEELPEEIIFEAESEDAETERPPQPTEADVAMVDTADLRQTIASAVEQVLEEPVAVQSPEEDTKDLNRLKKVIDITNILPMTEQEPEKAQAAEEADAENLPEQEPVMEELSEEEDSDEVAVSETVEEESEAPDQPEGYPGEPEGADEGLSLEQVMSQTVEAVLEDDDAILEPREPLKQRLTAVWETIAAKAITLWSARRGGKKANNSLWETPQNEQEEPPLEPEPDMEQASREEKRYCKKWYKTALYMAVPTAILIVLSALDALHWLPQMWQEITALRFGVMGGLLLAVMLLAAPMWRQVLADLKDRRIGCELAAGVSAVAALADCLYGALFAKGDNLPFAAPAAMLLCACLYGKLQAANARREAFHLADLGGKPPYAVAVTAAGACKQHGRLEGFYHLSDREDPARRWQQLLVPLLLAMATVLTGVVCLSDHKMDQFFWIWSAMLTASLPLSLPLTGTLPLSWLNHRLVKSGSAVAGYAGARMVSRSKRMVLTDDDLFPPGTVGLNGLKIYGEEIGKVVSYAATVARAARSQLSPLFEQLLASEGGFHMELEDLHFYEEGGVGGTIQGETVTMGSAYFMKKNKVTLPRELKIKTGVFLAVDGQLIAIFAIKYQPSRNVEWALQAIRRSRMQPVLAVRSGNITPGLLHRKFNLDVKPVYPDVSTRLALSDLSAETAEKPGALIYREGLMPFAETVIGSRRLMSAVRIATILCYVGAVAGLLLSYYLTHVGIFDALTPLRMTVFLLLWLIPTLLLSGMVKHF